MEEVKLERLHPGLPVSDVKGSRIGTLAHVHQQQSVGEPTDAEDANVVSAPAGEKVIEVKTGFLGLGKHLYVPARAIETVTDDQVIVDRPREALQEDEWSTRPAGLVTLS